MRYFINIAEGAIVKWSTWTTGQTDWSFGALRPDEVLYSFDGPAIFTCRIGFDTYLFYKADEHKNGDYYVAASISPEELAALKAGELSVRGALAQQKCWLMDVDLDFEVRRYEQRHLDTAGRLLPRHGVALLSGHRII